MPLIAGSSPSVIAENVRLLRSQGLSESDATARAMKHAKAGSKTVMHYTPPTTGRSFAIYTSDFSGLGWAKVLQDEGESVVLVTKNPETEAEFKRQFDTIGEGWIPTMSLKEAGQLPDGTYHIF